MQRYYNEIQMASQQAGVFLEMKEFVVVSLMTDKFLPHSGEK